MHHATGGGGPRRVKEALAPLAVWRRSGGEPDAPEATPSRNSGVGRQGLARHPDQDPPALVGKAVAVAQRRAHGLRVQRLPVIARVAQHQPVADQMRSLAILTHSCSRSSCNIQARQVDSAQL